MSKTIQQEAYTKPQPPYDFDAYTVGICYASVCSSLSLEETTYRLNKEHPTGTTYPWSLSEKPFITGAENPCPCHDYPKTHKHYLFSC